MSEARNPPRLPAMNALLEEAGSRGLQAASREAVRRACEAALDGMRQVRPHLRGDVYAVLGNHDTICMVPGLEGMGIRMLLNEHVVLERGGEHIYLAGIDDALLEGLALSLTLGIFSCCFVGDLLVLGGLGRGGAADTADL